MPLFHPRIIEKHTQSVCLPSSEHLDIIHAWAENLVNGIYNSETKNDGQFIQRILVELLGYQESNAVSPWTVQKNQPVGKGNVDVALGFFTSDTVQIIAPFELKGAKTHDLDALMSGRNKSPVQQAWEYAMDAKGAKWVLVSNYREIRLYAVGYGRKDYEKFDLTQLAKPEEYKRFILLLSATNLLGGHTLNLLKESENKEKEITNKLYQDYKSLRSKMIETLTNDNPSTPALDIIQHTQTLLDRVLFIAFAEDRGLLPKDTLKDAFEDRDKYNPRPVWDNFKGLFNAIDKGSPPLNITGYNGGLFANNDEINDLTLSEELCKGFKKIGEYDFDSDVSVNILGHIFEQSISDLEDLKAQASGEASFDKKKSKRKKDGIFYTPPYITRYIVEQAVGGWLNDRKQEIGFDKLPELMDVDFASVKIIKSGKNTKTIYNANIEQHIKAWEAYSQALSNIKVLDPACGSGAFLNEVFDYLYREGQTVNSELTTLNANQAQLFRWDTHIIANNIYGVDINPESVEITKLSLWLKTANKGEKLTYLDDNIKLGNSLIDDRAIAGDLAFNWDEKFADIMSGGGFDVVVGNPPWGADLGDAKEYLMQKAQSTIPKTRDSYFFFISKGIFVTKDNGYLSFILPNTWLLINTAADYRKWILSYLVKSIVDYGDGVFEDVITECATLILKKTNKIHDNVVHLAKYNKGVIINENYIEQIKLVDNTNGRVSISRTKADTQIESRIVKISKPFGEVAEIIFGAKPYQVGHGIPEQTKEMLTNRIYHSLVKIDDKWKPILEGRHIGKYSLNNDGHEFILYGKNLMYPSNETKILSDKILLRRTSDKLMAYIDIEKYYCQNSLFIITSNTIDLRYLLLLLNSKLFQYLYRVNNPQKGKVFAEVKPSVIKELPIVIPMSNSLIELNSKAEIMLAKNKELHALSSKFLTLLKSEFTLDKFSNKLEQWYTLDFAAFIAELVKKKIVLSPKQKAGWMEHFEEQKFLASAIKSIIDTTDAEIDQMVYDLYGLTPDEIAIVEGS
jgi:type I restriction-modification system DNA methylase subunit